MLLRALLIAFSSLSCTFAGAEPPRVATDILPVHSLVARVMAGIGEPSLILPPNASPHGYAMRPSEAQALAEADLLVWIGAPLTPWLARAAENLNPGAGSLALLEAPETEIMAFREDAAFADQDDHDHNDGHDHDHGPVDPHAWLDPRNGAVWLSAIAEALARIDPENQAHYRRNAAHGQAEILGLSEEVNRLLEPARPIRLLAFHDSLQYFEKRFDINILGAIAPGDASSPGAARLQKIRALLSQNADACVITEPQQPRALVETVTDGTAARIISADILGGDLAPGPELYPRMLRQIAGAIARCR